MTDSIIPFPLSHDDHYRQAQIELKNGEIHGALYHLWSILEEDDQNWPAMALITDVYLEENEVSEIEWIWKDFLTPAGIADLPPILIDSFLEIYPVLPELSQNKLLLYELRELHDLNSAQTQRVQVLLQEVTAKDRIEDLIDKMRGDSPQTIAHKVEALSDEELDLLTHSLFDGAQAQDLPLLQELLIDPRLSYSHRYFLLYMTSEMSDQRVDYLWRGQIISVSLGDLIFFEDTSVYQELQAMKDAYCQDYMPHMEGFLGRLIDAQLMYFYPNYEVIQEDMDQWFHLLLEHLDFPMDQTPSLTSNHQEQKQWIKGFMKTLD